MFRYFIGGVAGYWLFKKMNTLEREVRQLEANNQKWWLQGDDARKRVQVPGLNFSFFGNALEPHQDF